MAVPPRLDDFHLRGLLGVGLFAEVFLAERKLSSTRKQFALKQFRFRRELEKDAAVKERNILVRISACQSRDKTGAGNFIVRLFYAFQPSPREACLVTSLGCGTDLHDLVKQFPMGALSDDVARFYLAETAMALEFLHDSCHVVHTDLKLENMLIDDSGHLLLCDFNLSYYLPPEKNIHIVARDGTLATMAPEVAAYVGYSFPADIWSFGMIAVQMVTGSEAEPPAKLSWKEKYAYVAQGHLPSELRSCSGPFKTFVQAVLKKNPCLRPTAAQLKKLPFFKKLKWAAVMQRKVPPPCQPFGNLPGARRDIGLGSKIDYLDEVLADFDYVDPEEGRS